MAQIRPKKRNVCSDKSFPWQKCGFYSRRPGFGFWTGAMYPLHISKAFLLTYKIQFPAGIWCQNDVVSTSMRRDHVASTLTRRHITSHRRRHDVILAPNARWEGLRHVCKISQKLPNCEFKCSSSVWVAHGKLDLIVGPNIWSKLKNFFQL